MVLYKIRHKKRQNNKFVKTSWWHILWKCENRSYKSLLAWRCGTQNPFQMEEEKDLESCVVIFSRNLLYGMEWHTNQFLNIMGFGSRWTTMPCQCIWSMLSKAAPFLDDFILMSSKKEREVPLSITYFKL
jgi:hypothetical protein